MDELNIETIETYIVNLKHRQDRRTHILNEFKARNEFNIHFVEAIEHVSGSFGLWMTIQLIIRNRVNEKDEFVLICEDDHQFTVDYSKDILLSSITMANQFGADILVGGASSVKSVFRVKESMLWIEGYTGNQFLIIFKRFFSTFLNAPFNIGQDTDLIISAITLNKYLMYPFVSIQKEFGYSDVTIKNNEFGHVNKLFESASEGVSYILERQVFYNYNKRSDHLNNIINKVEEYVIPLYFIAPIDKINFLQHIENEFSGKVEFEINVISLVDDVINEETYYNGFKHAIQNGIDKDEDVIIICNENHCFTKYYSSTQLLIDILGAHNHGADILCGGTNGGFSIALPVANNRFWVNQILSTQCLVIFKKFYTKVIESSFADFCSLNEMLSQLSSNIMLTYPFISSQCASLPCNNTGDHTKGNKVPIEFIETSDRLLVIQTQFEKSLI